MKFNSIKNLQLQSTVDILSTITGTVTCPFPALDHKMFSKAGQNHILIMHKKSQKDEIKKKKCSIKCDGKLIFQFFQENLKIPID